MWQNLHILRLRWIIPLHASVCFQKTASMMECWDDTFTYEKCCEEDGVAAKTCWTAALAELGLTQDACCATRGVDQHSKLLKVRLHAVRAAVDLSAVAFDHGDVCSNTLTVLCNTMLQLDAIDFVSWIQSRHTSEFCISKVEARSLYRLSLTEAAILHLTDYHEKEFSFSQHHCDFASRLHTHRNRKGLHIFRAESRRFDLKPGGRTYHQVVKGRLDSDGGEMEAMHIAMVASVGQPVYGTAALAGIRSALFYAKRRHLIFHLIVDEPGLSDTMRAIQTLESWLKAKGSFEMHHVDDLGHVFDKIYSMVPKDDGLSFSKRYGHIGLIRLFPQDVFQDLGIEVLLWVDAGDYIFMDDPALLVEEHQHFADGHLIGAPFAHALPVQLFDLKKMRSCVEWSDMVASAIEQGYKEMGNAFFGLGEGNVFNRMLRVREIWYWFWSSWAYEPWVEYVPGFGVKNIWKRWPCIWESRDFPGLEDFMSVKVHCPKFQEAFFQGLLLGWSDSIEFLKSTLVLARTLHMRAVSNGTFIDSKGQRLRCNERARGVHLVRPFHIVPWAHRLLNFWVGSKVWDNPGKDRDLLNVTFGSL